MYQDFRYQPAVLKIAEAFREADSERLAHEARQPGSDHRSPATAAVAFIRQVPPRRLTSRE
jgi:hypothetical protein